MPDTSASATKSLGEIVTAQLDALRALRETLEAEQHAIIARDVEALDRVTSRKSEQLHSLKTLEALRREATAAVGATDLAELGHLLADLRTRNRANAALIAAQRQHLSRLLRLLRGAPESQHYGRDGRQHETGRRSTLATA